MNKNKKNQHVNLSGGRLIGIAEYGPSDGFPVFYFHGFPSSRLDWELIHDEPTVTDLGVRIIAPDRPGYGLSDFKRGRTMLSWAEDVVDIATELKIDRFAVLGVSGGGPYAAACAYGIRDRLSRTGIVCGMGPRDAPGMTEGASWTLPGTQSIVRRVVLYLTSMGLQRDPARFLEQSMEAFAEPDRKILEQPNLGNIFINGMREAFRTGIGGANLEAGLYTRPWGFALQDISTEVYLWHGEQDLNVPVSVGRYVAEAIPNSTAKFYPDDGHLTLPRSRLKEILSALIA